ncbi:hypothetical protein [Streptomyces rimosus]
MTGDNFDETPTVDAAEQSDDLMEGVLYADIRHGVEALQKLGVSSPELARSLALLVEAVALEAARTARFSGALSEAFAVGAKISGSGSRRSKNRSRRRAKGPIDPFAVFAHEGPDGLRSKLGALNLEQLRNIVAEHGMDYDRLAMKWKDPQRVVERIVERVEARSAKGSAFRAPARGASDVEDK